MPTDPEATGPQLAGLVAAGIVEAVGFGVALAILALGRPMFTRLANTTAKATAAQLTTAWLLGSWWPHTALHMHFGLKANALVGLELGFHAGSILAAAVLLWTLVTSTTTDPTATASTPLQTTTPTPAAH